MDTLSLAPRGANSNALLRLPSVIALTGMGRATVYAKIDSGFFPRPVKLGAKLAAWPQDEIERINGALIAGKSPDEIKALVTELMTARKARV